MIVVVKAGTSTLTEGGGELSRRSMLNLAQQLAAVREGGDCAILVSSGAVAAGGKGRNRGDIAMRQMWASMGQVALMQTWRELFAIFHIEVGQLLLTRSDFANRKRYLNIRDLLLIQLRQGILPIINENDAIVMHENRVGDNDNLAALVANMVAADLLLLLTDQLGLFTASPQSDPQARLIEEVTHIDAAVRMAAQPSGSLQGTGGMVTKIQAAELATQSGTEVVITSLQARSDLLAALLRRERVGTHFLAQSSRSDSRKRWMVSEQPQGEIYVDTGASLQLQQHGASLLPAGVCGVEGSFDRGSIVKVVDERGVAIAVGLSNYSSGDVHTLRGISSRDIQTQLGYHFGSEIIHRDHLVLLYSLCHSGRSP